MADAGNVYVGQTLLDITLNTGIDLTNATEVLIKYKKPISKVEGSFTVAQGLTVIDTTKLKYIFQTGDLDEKGTWSFWTHVIINGKQAPGKVYRRYVYIEGTA
jgi:hypothetical protein